MSSATFIIIGGGVIGLSTAYHLARKNAGRIIVLEKDQIGDGSSIRAAGITSGLMWNKTGIEARRLGIEWFRRMSEELGGYQFHDEHGCLNLFTPEQWPAREALLPLYEQSKVSFEIMTAAEINKRWPDLHAREEWIGLLDPRGGYSEPDEYIDALCKKLRSLGVELRDRCGVEEFLLRGDAVFGVRVGDQRIEADAVISTVHAWSHSLWRQIGLRFPMKTFVHQRYVTSPLSKPLVAPPVNADVLCGYVRPAAGNRILMGVETPDRSEHQVDSASFRMADLGTPVETRDQAASRFESFVPTLKNATWESEHIGLLSFTVDGDPVIGPVGRRPGLFVGASFHSGGFSYNTIAGLSLAEFVMDGGTSVDLTAFAPDRYLQSMNDSEIDAYLSKVVPQSAAVRRRH